MKSRLVTLCLMIGFFLPVLSASAQSAADRATLVIVDSREPKLWDYRVRFYDETGAEVATMKKCEIVRLSLTPGPHKFRSNKDKKKVIAVNAVAGETYYARAGIKMILFPQSMWFEFELLTRKEAESWVGKCNLAASALDAESPEPKQHP